MDTAVHSRAKKGGKTAAGPDLLAKAHLVGATASGVEGLALWLASRGLDVTGSIDPADQDGPAADRLRSAGVEVTVGFDAGHVRTDRTAVVWPGVVVAPHPELDRAQKLGLPVLARAHALAEVCAGFGRPLVAVGGSHSTATASAVLAAALDDGRTGWILNAPDVGGSPGQGGGRRLVVDLCPDTDGHEAAPPGAWGHRPHSPNRYRRPSPSTVLITATAANAPHFADNIEALDAATNLARAAATVVLPTWEKGPRIVHERLTDRPGPAVVTVGLDESADVWVLKPRWLGTGYLLTLRHQGEQHQFVVKIAGDHHALAACAAIATALVAGESAEAVAERLARFGGVERSLTELGTRARVTVCDSRARHPQEVARDVEAARMLTEGSVVAVLEPDGIARTSAHAAELGAALAAADRAVLLPAATPLTVLHQADPLDAVATAAVEALGSDTVHRVRSGPCERDIEQLVTGLAEPGDLVLVIGTGDAARLGPRLLEHLAQAATPTADRP
ncbi:UDP-N-acetylmuramate--alanine ligase [Kitasatospora sp. MAA19]|uniref:Mur ligase domain-containing protein n=1 Tax=unclassified Kitasatospora TaxID=2633591 RepID=UPI0024748E19|nr:Mur ligase domain-containing protein [Kitasatospora sp. MAA19]MDH6709194.1 UDP-N-acetylmuramate--alanine ligase [Kitasatospora sp. MAA19]